MLTNPRLLIMGVGHSFHVPLVELFLSVVHLFDLSILLFDFIKKPVFRGQYDKFNLVILEIYTLAVV